MRPPSAPNLREQFRPADPRTWYPTWRSGFSGRDPMWPPPDRLVNMQRALSDWMNIAVVFLLVGAVCLATEHFTATIFCGSAGTLALAIALWKLINRDFL